MPVIPLEQDIPEIPERKPWLIPTSYLEKDGKGGYLTIKSRRPSKTLLVNSLREEVNNWRNSGYIKPKGISQTSLRLLEYWFDEEHQINGESFHFWFNQREAIETTIYLYEVKGIRDNALLAETFMDAIAYGSDLFNTRKEIIETARTTRILSRVVPETGLLANQDLPPEGLTRYCVKSATGSGKTYIMAFIAVWSYFHKKFESGSNLSKTILIIAPNVIVYERLKSDFAGGILFSKFPFIPDEWKYDWQMSCIMREDQVKTSTDGTLYLTNIHQIYESRKNGNDENEDKPVGKLLGLKPQKDSTASWLTSIIDRIQIHDDLVIINDEAHHVHDEDLEWYRTILMFHENIQDKSNHGLSLLFDLSATPKDQNGTYFPWIIKDYPLAQAIEDRIVKTPLIVHQSDKSSPDNKQISNAYNAYNEWIQIALNRYREHWDCYYKNLKQKPVLFVMAEETKQADQIADGIKNIVDFKGKDEVVVIHTKKDGSLSTDEKSLQELREIVKKIDNPKSKVKVVVSVMMLREGWDVKNVSIILGLRPFTSKANILPEQAVGRGLRLMQNIGTDYTQVLEVIGTDKFEEFVKGLEKEGVGVGVTIKNPAIGVFIYPLKTREKYNFEIPVLTSSFTRKMEGISSFNVSKLMPIGELDESGNFREFTVTLKVATLEKKVGTKQITIEDDDYVSIQEILQGITNKIIKEGKFQCKFPEVFKIVKNYTKNYCFKKEVELESLVVRRTLAKPAISEKVILLIARALGEHIRMSTEMKITNYPISLIELDGFYWKRKTAECEHTVFNFTPVYNELEKAFAEFLDKAPDINKFAALAESYTKFSITYLNKKGGQGLYYPDYIAEQQLKNGKCITWIIETKGYEDENVPFKDAEAMNWSKKASTFTKTEWRFLKVSDSFFRGSGQRFNSFLDMVEKLEKHPELMSSIKISL